MDYCIEREGTRANSNKKIYKLAQKYNSVSSIRISMLLIDAFRHFWRICFNILYEFIGLLNLGYLSHLREMTTLYANKLQWGWLFFTKVNTVFVNNSKDLLVKKWQVTRKKGRVTEILEKIKKRKREVKVHLKREPLKGSIMLLFYKM